MRGRLHSTREIWVVSYGSFAGWILMFDHAEIKMELSLKYVGMLFLDEYLCMYDG